MSIFKDSFHLSIQEQLKTRQTAINNRTPQNLTYYNSRNAWIRLSSSVNIFNKNISNPTLEQLKDPGNYDNTLANQYILQGGILNPVYDPKTNTYSYNKREGIGNFSNANNNVTKGSMFPTPGTQLRIPVNASSVINLFNQFNTAR